MCYWTRRPFVCLIALGCLTAPLIGADAFPFEYRVSPLLVKIGCSAAECHGAASGKGGFKLSLFADDPLRDYWAITQELDGRRLDYGEPNLSLFLRKPSRQGVKHGGGRLLHPEDLAYQDLLGWVARGAKFSEGPWEALTGLAILPRPEGIRVEARFRTEQGETARNVTRLALLESSDQRVATVDAAGNIQEQGPGEAWILARYGKLSARWPIRRPFGPVATTEGCESDHSLDRVWLTCLDRLGLTPAPAAPPETLLRRLYMDLAGRPPDPFELLRFRQMPAAGRIVETVDHLLESPDFDRVFAGHLAGYYEIPVPQRDGNNARARNERLRAAFLSALQERTSLATIAERVLTEPSHQIAWKSLPDPRDRAEYIGRTLLGIRIGCARCHNHPLDRWTQQEHLAFSAYFTDPRPAADGGMMAGKLFLPEGGREVTPRLLPLVERNAPAGLDRQQEMAWFVLDAGRTQFARNMANRVFGTLMGRALVERPGDHRLTNPARHEPILSLLTEKLIDMDTQLRPFVRYVVTSRLYALSSDPVDAKCVSGDPELAYLARRGARPLSASQFKRAVESVLGVEIDRELPPESPLARQLYILNSGLIQEGLDEPGNQVEAILDFQPDPREQLIALYRLILSRDPRVEEQAAFQPLLAAARGASRPGRDLAVALLAGREFGTLR